MSDNDSTDNSLTYQQETAQDMLCLCAIVLVVGAILVIAYLQDTEKKLLKAIVGGVLIVLGAVPCIVLCICIQKMSDEATEMNQFESMHQFRAMASINRLDGTMRRFDRRLALSRLESVEQEAPLSFDETEGIDTVTTETEAEAPLVTVPTITVTISPTEDTEEDVVINKSEILPSENHIRYQLPPRRGSLFESVAEVFEAMSITR